MSAFDISEDIKPLLVDITTPHIYGELIPDLDICIAIQHTGGYSPTHTFSGGDASLQKPIMTHPSFEIIIRHPQEHIMHGWWDNIINALDGKTNYSVNGRTYLIIEQNMDMRDEGRDENRRHIQSLGFNTTVINTR